MLHSWFYYPSTLSCSQCLRLEKNKYTFGSVGVFHQQGPYTWSLPRLYEQVHFEQNMEEFYNSQTPPSEGPGSTSTNILSRMVPTPHFELLGKRRTWVTLYQEVQTSRSTPESNDAPKEWTRWEVLFRRLKTLNPRRKVKLVVINIYILSAFPFPLNYLLSLNGLLVNHAIL